MTDRILSDKGIGYVPIPSAIRTEDGKITEQTAAYFSNVVAGIASAINGQLSFGDGSQSSKLGNLDGACVHVLTPTPADTEFKVAHGLGRLPVFCWPGLPDGYARIKASNLGSWNAQWAYLKCDAAGVTLRLIFL